MSGAGFDAARSARALAIVRGAFDREGSERARWIATETAGDAALRAEVDRLLAADGDDAGPLDRPLLEQVTASDEGADPRLGTRVGPFVLRSLLGRGGMGSVYRAERESGDFQQRVAVKLLRRADDDDAGAARRFARERQILVRLQHPHIAHFLDGGVTADGQPWYALELVDGVAITQHADRVRASVDERLRWVMQVCDAVQYAHQNLVLHRDLKPANILVDAQAQVKLLDFGIAKLLRAESDTDGVETRTEHRAFTPDYAAPEQIDGSAVSTATDIFALGVLLFELLTGRRPFRRGGALGALSSSTDGAVEAPSRVLARETGDPRRASVLRGDLDTIVLTCLQVDPARRYASAAALKRDIERHLDGLPIDARPDSFGYRASKFVRRHRFGVTAGSVLVIALLVATVASITQARRAERESARATALAVTAQRERDAARDETRRQEILSEHFVAVINRATESGEDIKPDALMALAADPGLLGEFGDARMRVALQLELIELTIQSSDYPRALTLLDALEPTLPEDDGRSRALAAADRAVASVRVGKLDDAEAAIARARATMTPEQRSGGLLVARLLLSEGQLLRARGDNEAATKASLAAAETVATSTDSTAMERGAIVGAGATALLMTGDLDTAVRLADEAQAIWRKAGVANNFSMRTVATQRANALFLRGNLLAALAELDAIDSDTGVSESAPARAARGTTRAKILALLGRGPEAVEVIEAAVRSMCASVGPESRDCLIMRLSQVDAKALAGEAAAARTDLVAILPEVAAQPTLLTTAQSFERSLALRLEPGPQTLEAVIQAMPATAAASGLARRNAVRALLMLAENSQREGRDAEAQRLARGAIEIAGSAIDGKGMDQALLALWQARLDGQSPPEAAMAQLAAAMGPQHPFVTSRLQSSPR